VSAAPLALGVVLGAVSAPCRAQQPALTVDATQGLALGEGSPTPYLFHVTVAPAVDIGRVRLAVVIAPSYRNPAWDVGLGGQASVFMPVLTRDIGVRLAVQGESLPHEGSTRFSAGVIAEALGLFRLGVWPAYVPELDRAEFSFSVGFDVLSWMRLFSQQGSRSRLL